MSVWPMTELVAQVPRPRKARIDRRRRRDDGRVGVEVRPQSTQSPRQSGRQSGAMRLRERDGLAHGRRQVQLMMIVQAQRVGLVGHVHRQAGVDVDRRQRLLLELDVHGAAPGHEAAGAGLHQRRRDSRPWARMLRPVRVRRTSPSTARRARRPPRWEARAPSTWYVRAVPGCGAQQLGDVIAEHALAGRPAPPAAEPSGRHRGRPAG